MDTTINTHSWTQKQYLGNYLYTQGISPQPPSPKLPKQSPGFPGKSQGTEAVSGEGKAKASQGLEICGIPSQGKGPERTDGAILVSQPTGCSRTGVPKGLPQVSQMWKSHRKIKSSVFPSKIFSLSSYFVSKCFFKWNYQWRGFGQCLLQLCGKWCQHHRSGNGGCCDSQTLCIQTRGLKPAPAPGKQREQEWNGRKNKISEPGPLKDNSKLHKYKYPVEVIE